MKSILTSGVQVAAFVHSGKSGTKANDDIWYHLRTVDKFVYHYTTASSFQKIFDTRTLRFSTFRRMNDPRETKDFPFSFSFDDERNEELHQLKADLAQCAKTSWCLDPPPLKWSAPIVRKRRIKDGN